MLQSLLVMFVKLLWVVVAAVAVAVVVAVVVVNHNSDFVVFAAAV